MRIIRKQPCVLPEELRPAVVLVSAMLSLTPEERFHALVVLCKLVFEGHIETPDR